MANNVATLMLFVWPLVAIWLFKRLPAAQAAAITLVAGYLILPVDPRFKIPLIPAYGKDLAAALPAMVLAWMMTRPDAKRDRTSGALPQTVPLPGLLPGHLVIKVCFLLVLVAPLGSALTNPDAQIYRDRSIQGLGLYDAGSGILTISFVLLPFLIARKFMSGIREQRILLGVFCVAALGYSLLALYEVRMSPQLNRMVYGFFPHSWAQHQRAGGFRPLVFLEHGLRLGIFLAVAILATAGYWRAGPAKHKRLALAALGWLVLTLVLSKNLTAFLIVMALLPVICFLHVRTQLIVAACLAGMVLVYPTMRAAGLVPTETILSGISAIAEEGRVRSLRYRFNNEDILLDKANERPLFGWGGWGRSRVYDERGVDISTTDGVWIIEFGEKGWFGYLGKFGLMTLPIILLAFRRREGLSLETSILSIALAGNLVDLIPNSGLTPITWMLAGSLAGRLEAVPAQATDPETEAESRAPGRASPYRRTLSDAPQAGRRRASTYRRPETGGRRSALRR